MTPEHGSIADDNRIERENGNMPSYQPLQPMTPLIMLTLGSLSVVSLAQGAVIVTSHSGASGIAEIIAGVIGLALTVWVAVAMRGTSDDDDDGDNNDDDDHAGFAAHADTASDTDTGDAARIRR